MSKRMMANEVRVRRSINTSTSSSWGQHIFKKDVFEVYVPYTQGQIVVKLLPGLNPDDLGETFDPMMLDDGSWGNWQAYIPVVSCGESGKTVTYCEYTDFYNPQSTEESPYSLAYNMCRRMANMNDGDMNKISDWVNLIKNGNATQAATMPPVSVHLLAYCIPFITKKGVYDYTFAKKKLHILNLKKKATEALFNICEKCVRQDNPIDLTLPNAPFLSMWSGAASNPYTGEAGNRDKKDYNTKLMRKLQSGLSSDFSSDFQEYTDRIESWGSLIECPSFEQQARWLMGVLPLDLLAQAWSDTVGYKEFVTEDMAKTLESGRIRGWQIRQQKMQAQMGQYSQQFAQAIPQPVASQSVVLPKKEDTPFLLDDEDDVIPVEQPKKVSARSSIPGMIAPPAYAPAPEEFSNLVDEINFDDEDDSEDSRIRL